MLWILMPLVLCAGAAVAQRGRMCPVKQTATLTPAQKAYVTEACQLCNQVCAKQQEIKKLQAQKVSATTLRAKQAQLNSLRAKLQTLNAKHQSLRGQWTMQSTDCCGNGPCGGNPSACPYSGSGKGACQMNGTGACPYGQAGRGACRRQR